MREPQTIETKMIRENMIAARELALRGANLIINSIADTIEINKICNEMLYKKDSGGKQLIPPMD